MINIFNRKELTITFSMKKQSEIRNILSANKIEHITRVVNRNSPSPFSGGRGRTGTFGQNPELSNEYIFYVRKDDYEYAKHCIGQ
jgi:hypothetical protein